MSTQTIEKTDIDPTTGKGRVAHIVKKEGLTEAYVIGNPVTALCGHVWVPSRDPKQYPICQQCKEIADLAWGDDSTDGLE